MRYLIYLIFIVSTSLNAGTILKWVDEDGNVYYGDAPPVSTKTEPVSVQSAPSNPGKALPRLSSPGTAGTDTSATAGNTPDSAKAPPDQAKIACQQAQDDLKVISNSSRVKLKSADGTTRYLSSEEIDERKQQAQADISQFCN